MKFSPIAAMPLLICCSPETREGRPMSETLFERSHDPRPKRFLSMRDRYGPPRESGATCGSCRWLQQVKHGARSYFKCGLYGSSMSSHSDWRKKWEGCGAHQPIEVAGGRDALTRG